MRIGSGGSPWLKVFVAKLSVIIAVKDAMRLICTRVAMTVLHVSFRMEGRWMFTKASRPAQSFKPLQSVVWVP